MTQYTVKQSFYDEQLGQYNRGEVVTFEENRDISRIQDYLVEGQVDFQLEEDAKQMQQRIQDSGQPDRNNIIYQQQTQATTQPQASLQEEVKRANRKVNDNQ